MAVMSCVWRAVVHHMIKCRRVTGAPLLPAPGRRTTVWIPQRSAQLRLNISGQTCGEAKTACASICVL
ncbi:hypothetical protein EYF80_021578 [Liparis tanakae]|uniref:Uncharacterized protein n=1 Tax=Liparis tanakae TaxID=230148 RepID=A0A4Z2HQY6_9TELE|nr:hypothetical protein EYF80_021578 [Liparis tanakae]